MLPVANTVEAALAGYAPHALHTADRHWPQTNCYVDLWVELLHAQGFDPLAVLGFTVAQDYEGDHFTFAKVPIEDLEVLYGLAVQELAIYDRLEAHLHGQAMLGRVTLVEVDGFYLPDTRGLTYCAEHGKTTIGIRHIDPASRRMAYFHNSGLYVLEAEDYDGIFGPQHEAALPPYVEFMRQRGTALRGADLAAASRARFATWLARRPSGNPVSAWRADLLDHQARILSRPPAFFHQYAFNFNRQLGMNWELLGSYLNWLQHHGEAGLDLCAADCGTIAEAAKALQFRMARLAGRRKQDACADLLDTLEAAYDRIVPYLADRFCR